MPSVQEAHPRPAYDDLACAYDLLIDPSRHTEWLLSIERLARRHGLRERTVLDIGCGTGASFLPLLDLGYAVTACDLSPAMVALAMQAARGRACVHVADMRSLPEFGAVALTTCLNDGVNHLADEQDVLACFSGVRRNLQRGGLFIFDATTPLTYANARDALIEDADRTLLVRGDPSRLDDGGVAEVHVDVFSRAHGDLWRRRTFRQRQRHYPVDTLQALLDQARLRLVAAYGQLRGGVLEPQLDARRHPKALLVAQRP